MVKENWKIWNKNHKVEERTFARTLKKLLDTRTALDYINEVFRQSNTVVTQNSLPASLQHSA